MRDHVDSVELPPGTPVGPYRIERPLGRGGMGIVYLGVRADGQFEQRVAIKFLARRVAAPQIHDSFRRERQTVAALNHAHIAHLLDGGVMEDGRLWFAVELVDGLPIDSHCAEQKLNLHERVALLAPIVAAVQYAHSRLLVHRDIKPGNVLVDKEGGAKLLDFGAATFVDERDAAIAYTPEYASPEQRAGERIDTSSDIWQLGNLLRIVLGAHTAAEKPLTVPPDLQAIIAKACAPRIAQRYHTAQGLHADLSRFLAYQPVRARRPTLGYRFSRLVRRHPFGFAAAACVALLLAGAIALGWRLSIARSRAFEERQLATLVTHFLTHDLIGEADPFGGGPHATVDLGSVLARASEHAEVTFAKHPRLASEVDLAIGDALDEMSRNDDARRIVQRGLARLDPNDPENFDLVMSLKVTSVDVDAETRSTVDTRRELAKLRDDVAKVRGEFSPLALHIDTLVGQSLWREARFAECQEILQTALAHPRELRPSDSFLAHIVLTECFVQRGRYAEARTTIGAQVRSSAALYGENDPRTLLAREVQFTIATLMGDYANALDQARPLLTQMRKTLGPDNDALGGTLSDAGFAATCAGKPAEAIAYLEEAKAVRGKIRGDRSLPVARIAINEGLAQLRLGDLPAADQALAFSASILRGYPAETTWMVSMLKNRGELRLAEHRYEEASADFEEALSTARTFNADDHPRVASAKLGLAIAFAHIRRTEEAQRLMTEAMTVFESHPFCWQPLVDMARATSPLVSTSPNRVGATANN